MSLEASKAVEALLWAPPPSSAHPGSPWRCQQQSCLARVLCCIPNQARPPSSSTLLLHNSMYRYSYVGNESSGWSDRQGGCVCVCVCVCVCASMHSSILLFSHSVVSHSLQPQRLQHVGLPCPSPSLRACSNSSPLSH